MSNSNSVSAAMLVNKMNLAFDTIGKNGTALPPSDRNDEGIAYEFFVSKHLKSRADARMKKAHEDAVSAGVIFDHNAEPKAPGNYTIYTGHFVGITCHVKSGTTKLDSKRLRGELIKAGIPTDKIDAAFNASTTTNRSAHEFQVAIID